MLVGNLLDLFILAQVLTVGSAERRVGDGENVLLLEPADEFGLGALDGEFDLVCIVSSALLDTGTSYCCDDLAALYSFYEKEVTMRRKTYWQQA